ncbi:MAG: DNA translocase FtsK 4TM domain-containing protein [Parvibaculaceae bacterium]
MAQTHPLDTDDRAIPGAVRRFVRNRLLELAGLGLLAVIVFVVVSLATWSVDDPSFNNAVDARPKNLLGAPGAIVSDQLMQLIGIGVLPFIVVPVAWTMWLFSHRVPRRPGRRFLCWIGSAALWAGFLSLFDAPAGWALGSGLGGVVGDVIANSLTTVLSVALKGGFATAFAGVLLAIPAFILLLSASGATGDDVVAFMRLFGADTQDWTARALGSIAHAGFFTRALWAHYGRPLLRRIPRPTFERMLPAPDREPRERLSGRLRAMLSELGGEGSMSGHRVEPTLASGLARRPSEPSLFSPSRPAPAAEELEEDAEIETDTFEETEEAEDDAPAPRVARGPKGVKQGKRLQREAQGSLAFERSKGFELPPLTLLAEPKRQGKGADLSDEALEQNARMLEGVLDDFGVRGEIIKVCPGPVVALYELEPAPGIKSSRVIGLADDIARSMSAVSARVAVIPGRNVIGIELPNARRETVYLRELLASQAYEKSGQNLALALGKNIGGEPILADLARMPHLLIAGTTGSGKSVGINTFILSLLYRMTPEQCRLIMIDPKMLELSVYEGIPHLLAPVVTDPRKAIVALKWAVREMEDRYRKMSKLGVRNIDGFNNRVKQAIAKGEIVTRTVQTGFDPHNGEPIFEQEEMELSPFPYIVVIIDEMADLMMVAGKDIEGAVQRLAQMARAAGIHVIMATQRPSVDVITGTIKANFPTRISFQVTSKIDSRTILGEQGAEQLLGQGDMLYMAGGGRISRLHGAFVTDDEVEKVVSFLKAQGAPDYVEAVTAEPEEGFGDGEGDAGGMLGEGGGSGDSLYDQAVAVVLRDRKVSTSYVQRRLQVGYNKAASLIERMEKEGLITAPNHAGKRDIIPPGNGGED